MGTRIGICQRKKRKKTEVNKTYVRYMKNSNIKEKMTKQKFSRSNNQCVQTSSCIQRCKPTYRSETCTAPKNRGGGGAEDEKNLNVVAMAATARKPFRVAARPLHASYFNRDGAVAPPYSVQRITFSILFTDVFTNMES